MAQLRDKIWRNADISTTKNRRSFTRSQKSRAFDSQDGVCDNHHCGAKLLLAASHVDHKDGYHWNNSDENCHYLCIPCHNLKTRVETACRTNEQDFEYEMMEQDPDWCSRHLAAIKMLMNSRPVMTEEQKRTKKELIVQLLQSLD